MSKAPPLDPSLPDKIVLIARPGDGSEAAEQLPEDVLMGVGLIPLVIQAVLMALVTILWIGQHRLIALLLVVAMYLVPTLLQRIRERNLPTRFVIRGKVMLDSRYIWWPNGWGILWDAIVWYQIRTDTDFPHIRLLELGDLPRPSERTYVVPFSPDEVDKPLLEAFLGDRLFGRRWQH